MSTTSSHSSLGALYSSEMAHEDFPNCYSYRVEENSSSLVIYAHGTGPCWRAVADRTESDSMGFMKRMIEPQGHEMQQGVWPPTVTGGRNEQVVESPNESGQMKNPTPPQDRRDCTTKKNGRKASLTSFAPRYADQDVVIRAEGRGIEGKNHQRQQTNINRNESIAALPRSETQSANNTTAPASPKLPATLQVTKAIPRDPEKTKKKQRREQGVEVCQFFRRWVEGEDHEIITQHVVRRGHDGDKCKTEKREWERHVGIPDQAEREDMWPKLVWDLRVSVGIWCGQQD